MQNNILSSEVNKAILEQVKAGELNCHMLQFFEKEKHVHKIGSRNDKSWLAEFCISFTSKFIWNHLYLFIICIIYLESSIKLFSTN